MNKKIGYVLLVIGGLTLFWAIFIFDTSVAVDAYTRVNNFGLLNDQRNYSIIGGFIALIGVFFIFKHDSENKNNPSIQSSSDSKVDFDSSSSTTDSTKNNAVPQNKSVSPSTVIKTNAEFPKNSVSIKPHEFNGERLLTNDAYKIFLSKKYNIKKNDLFNKFEVNNTKLFDTIDDALLYAFNEEEVLIEAATKIEIASDDWVANVSDAFAQKRQDMYEQHALKEEAKNESEDLASKYAEKNIAAEETKSAESDLFRNRIIMFLILLVIVPIIWLYSQSSKLDYDSLQGKPASILFTKDVIKNQVTKFVGYGNESQLSYFFEVASSKDMLKKDGIYLVGTGCMPHDCNNSQGLIFVNTQTNDVVVVTTTVNQNTFTSYGMDYSQQNKSFNKAIPPSAQRWLRKQDIRIK